MPDDKPWVLLRAGHDPVPFATLAEAQAIYDMKRRSGTAKVEAAVVGPNRERWRCNPWRWAYWFRDDRALPKAGDEDAAEPETAA
jgi:hypothetical protein